MNNYFKTLVAVLILVAIYGGYVYPKMVQQIVVGSVVGSTFNNAKVAAINMTPSSASATSSSILNTDASDRIVTDAFVTCSQTPGNNFAPNGGVATWIWQAATTSTNAPATLGSNSVNQALFVTVATSTADAYTATSTYTIALTRRWATGSYMTFQPNATSSTAVCNVGVHYLAT